MINQNVNVYKPLFTIMGNTSLWNVDDSHNQIKEENQTINAVVSSEMENTFTRKFIRAIYHFFKGSIVKMVKSDSDGKVVLLDIMSAEGACLHQYNSLDTTQTVHLLPVNADMKSTAGVPFSVNVKSIEEDCFEPVVEQKTEREEVSISIYNGSNTLAFK